MSLKRTMIAAGTALLFAAPVSADEVSDSIQTALDAYNDGDLAFAAEELSFALQLLKELRAGDLQSFLPEAQDGWMREDDSDIAAAAGFMGGTGAGARYVSDSTSDEFEIMLMMDSPMIASAAAMLANPAIAAASGGKLVRVGREKFVEMDGNVTGLVGNRIFIQAEGDDTDAIVAHLETMDFRALAQFGL